MRNTLHLLMIGVVLSVASCGETGSGARSSATRASSSTPSDSTSQAPGISIVALGDSDTTGAGDPTGAGWVGRYAALVQEATGKNVDTTNLAVEGMTSEQLLDVVRTDETARQDIAHADIVLIGIGGADLNQGDENLMQGSCNGKACYTPVLRTFARNFDLTVKEVHAIAGNDALVRAVTLPNALPGAERIIPDFVTPEISLYQAGSELRDICSSMKAYGGECVDVLHAFSGPNGTVDAYSKGLMNLQDCCYPSGKGQQLIAELLLETGLGSLGT